MSLSEIHWNEANFPAKNTFSGIVFAAKTLIYMEPLDYSSSYFQNFTNCQFPYITMYHSGSVVIATIETYCEMAVMQQLRDNSSQLGIDMYMYWLSSCIPTFVAQLKHFKIALMHSSWQCLSFFWVFIFLKATVLFENYFFLKSPVQLSNYGCNTFFWNWIHK